MNGAFCTIPHINNRPSVIGAKYFNVTILVEIYVTEVIRHNMQLDTVTATKQRNYGSCYINPIAIRIAAVKCA